MATTSIVPATLGSNPQLVVGASLLCFCMDPQWGHLYFLLGKERKNVRWSTGSERWSDFGGRSARTDSSPETTAAREFLEETLAMIQYFEGDTIPRTSYEDIADSLCRGEYTFRFTIDLGVVNGVRRCYITFVKQIPWDTKMVPRFNKCRMLIMNVAMHYGSVSWLELLSGHPAVSVPRHPGVAVQIRKPFLEKKSIGLWSIPQFQHALEFDGIMLSRNGHVERCRPAFTSFIEMLLGELNFYAPERMHETTTI